MGVRFWFEYTFKDGAVYRDPNELHWIEDDAEEGDWEVPFTNQPGNSFAYGSAESFDQCEIGYALRKEHGHIVRLKTWRA